MYVLRSMEYIESLMHTAINEYYHYFNSKYFDLDVTYIIMYIIDYCWHTTYISGDDGKIVWAT